MTYEQENVVAFGTVVLLILALFLILGWGLYSSAVAKQELIFMVDQRDVSLTMANGYPDEYFTRSIDQEVSK